MDRQTDRQMCRTKDLLHLELFHVRVGNYAVSGTWPFNLPSTKVKESV